MVAYPSPTQPETSDLLDAYARLGRPMVSSTASAPSLPRGSLCRQSSAIRTGCAKERPSGSEEGVASNHDLYSDLNLFTAISPLQSDFLLVRGLVTLGKDLREQLFV